MQAATVRRPLWVVSLADANYAIGTVEAETLEEALAKGIALAARRSLPPQALHLERQEG
jgi:hypothetical protein